MTSHPDDSPEPRRKRGSNRSLRKLASVVGFRGVSMALVLVQSIVLARVFGPEVFGVFSFAVSVISIVALVTSLGLDQYLMREVAKLGLLGLREDPAFRSVRRFSAVVAAPATLAVSIIGSVLALVPGLAGPYALPLFAAFASLGILMLRKFVESLALGIKRPNASFAGSSVAYPVVLILGAGLVWIGVFPPDSATISVVYVVAVIISGLVSALLVRDALPQALGGPRGIARDVDRRAALTASLHLTVIGAGFLLIKNVDIVMVGILSDPETVAAVRILSRLGEAVAIVRVMALTYYKPYLAEAGMGGDRASLQRHASSMAGLYLITGVPIFIGLWFAAPWILAIWGAEYVQYDWAFRVYMLGVFVMLIGGPANVSLSMSGMERYASRALWASLIANVGLNAALIPPLGVLGCSIASLTGMVVLASVSVFYARRRLGIATTGFDVLWRLIRKFVRAIR